MTTPKTCRTCFFCIPNYKGAIRYFHWGTCYQSQRKVQANMTACTLYQERKDNMVVKSTQQKRNKYQDKDGNIILGVTIPEILDKPMIIQAKREYTWGKYHGLAVKVEGENGKFGIVEITAETPIKALCMPQMPKHPYKAKFVQKTSQTGNKYYTVVTLNDNGEETSGNGAEEILPF